VENGYFNDGGGRVAPGLQFCSQATSSDAKHGCSSHADESFPKSARLLRRPEYLRVQGRGRKTHTRSLLILTRPNRLDRNRLGIAVSKKYGKSVQRNRIKRIIREVFRRNRQLFDASTDVVVVPKRVRHQVGYTMLLEELSKQERRQKK